MTSEAETLLLPGAIGYRAPVDTNITAPPASGDVAEPGLSRTLTALDNGDELGCDDEDGSSTQPGTPWGEETRNPAPEAAGLGPHVGTSGEDPIHPGFQRLSNRKGGPPKEAVNLGEAEADVINPDVPALPGPGTPELGNPDSPRVDPPEPPVPSKVPVFDLSQEDDDDLHESPPTPAPLVSVTKPHSVELHLNQLYCAPPFGGPRPLTIARHTQALESGSSRNAAAGRTRPANFVPNDGQVAGGTGKVPRESGAVSSSENEKPDLKKLKTSFPLDFGGGDELTDASMEEPPCPAPHTAPTHPYTPFRQSRGPRLPQQGNGWMDALQQIHLSLQDLHVKADSNKGSQDRTHAELVGLRAELQQQDIRTAHLEATTKEHTSLHEGTLLRVAALEQQVQELKSQDLDRSRSPTPARSRAGRARSPSQPRSPRDDRNPDEDLELVIGGWSEGRRPDVEHEVNQIFRKLQIEDRLHEVIIPYVRVNVCRVALKFPEGTQNIRAQRAFQTQTLEKLKSTKFLSGVPGSKNRELWMTKNRTPEERNKIRGLVQTKEFYVHVKYGDARPRETPEIDWRGRVYVGRVQALAEASNLPADADPADIYLCDSRGDHTGWVLLAARFEKITGVPKSEMAKLWETGPHFNMGREK